MEYVVEGQRFNLCYQDLRQHYLKFISMSDGDFSKSIPEALHFACIVCYLKEIPTYLCLSDKGIIHELTHLLSSNVESVQDIKTIRELFKNQLELA